MDILLALFVALVMTFAVSHGDVSPCSDAQQICTTDEGLGGGGDGGQ